MAYDKQARLLWSLAASGLGTTIGGSGNSGPWSYAQGSGGPRSPVFLAQAADVMLMVNVGNVTGTPSLKVQLGFFDDQGNLFQPAALQTAAITAAGQTLLSAGQHGGSASTYLTLPEWGQVAWTCTGGSATGVEIALYGR